tara:strand:+ start:1625 stop:2023 length:399 start_codon:yes stop_codon:yes gene_type:complete
MRQINKVFIHCSATKQGRDFDVKDIDLWHKQRGFSGVGYHYVIKLDGTIETGRPETKRGAHAKGYNSNSIGVCYIGGLDENNKPLDTRTKEQKISMDSLIGKLKDKYKGVECMGHNEVSSKACPCFNVQNEY